MSDILNTGVSGLMAFQRALSTTSHNIANSATPGFNRQQAVFAARVGTDTGLGSTGRGAEVSGVRRIYDQYLSAQVHGNTATLNRLDSFYQLSAQVDNMLTDGGNGVGTMMQTFFNAVDTLADDPASMVTREAFLGQTRELVERFKQIDDQLNTLDREVNNQIDSSISEINAIAQSIGDLNRQIVSGSADGQPPNDLLDTRDALITRLNEHVSVTTLPQGDGATNVFVGNGLSLVRGGRAEQLQTYQNEFQPLRQEVRIAGGPTIGSRLTGGTIGGALDFRREVLDPTRNTVGRLANGLADTLNAQHREGIDLQGNMGGDLFAVGQPLASASSNNVGTAGVTITIEDVSSVTTHDYTLKFDGGLWQLKQADTGVPVTMTGSGTGADPFRANGLAFEVSGGAVAGDRYLLRPNGNAAAGMRVLIGDPSKIAAASAVLASASLNNTGAAQITSGEVLDSSHPALLAPETINFIDATTYTIGASGPFSYTSGDPIAFNGWQVEISGTPAAGDSFDVKANTAGSGDNRNALLVSDLQSLRVLDDATASLSDSFATLAASVGTVTHHAGINRDAQQVLLENAEQSQLAVSGVNLDEEAANLLRYEQAYQAAARVISVADQLFQTLIGAVGR